MQKVKFSKEAKKTTNIGKHSTIIARKALKAIIAMI